MRTKCTPQTASPLGCADPVISVGGIELHIQQLQYTPNGRNASAFISSEFDRPSGTLDDIPGDESVDTSDEYSDAHCEISSVSSLRSHKLLFHWMASATKESLTSVRSTLHHHTGRVRAHSCEGLQTTTKRSICDQSTSFRRRKYYAPVSISQGLDAYVHCSPVGARSYRELAPIGQPQDPLTME